MSSKLTRRGFVAVGSSLVSYALPWPGRKAFGQTSDAGAGNEPHFLLHLCISGGMDPTYLFDARPNDMSKANVIANYLYLNKQNPTGDEVAGERLLHTGSNGGKCLRTTLTKPLEPYLDRMAILNGVWMQEGGQLLTHGQNMHMIFTGKDTANSNGWLPMIGPRRNDPLDTVHIGPWKGDGNGPPQNFGGSLGIDGGGSSLALLQDIRKTPTVDLGDPTINFLRERFVANAGGKGRFSTGAKALADSLLKGPNLNKSLIDAASSGSNFNSGGDSILAAVEIAYKLMSGRVSSSVSIMGDFDKGVGTNANFNLDSHSNNVAAALPTNMAVVVKAIAGMFEALSTRMIGDKRWIDCTTVLITTEFARTYKNKEQLAANVTDVGTDHNQFNNTIIVAGKGIKGGVVLGGSDMETLEEAKFENVSGAHKEKEKTRTGTASACFMAFGKPFDYQTGLPRLSNPKPAKFDRKDYLFFQSIPNTLLKMFGHDVASMYRDPTGTAYPTLDDLLLKKES